MKKAEVNISDPNIKRDLNHITVKLSVPEFDISSCEILSEEEFDEKRIASIERLIRSSYEYRSFITYMKNDLHITKDMLLPGLDISKYKFSLEMHHYPFTLFDLVDIIGRYLIKNNKSTDRGVSNFDIGELVMKEHYAGNVGLIPLSESMHKAFHNGAIKIPWSSVYSNNNVDKFVAKYRSSITDEEYDKYITAKTIDSLAAMENNKDILKKLTVDYDVNYVKAEDADDNNQ